MKRTKGNIKPVPLSAFNFASALVVSSLIALILHYVWPLATNVSYSQVSQFRFLSLSRVPPNLIRICFACFSFFLFVLNIYLIIYVVHRTRYLDWPVPIGSFKQEKIEFIHSTIDWSMIKLWWILSIIDQWDQRYISGRMKHRVRVNCNVKKNNNPLYQKISFAQSASVGRQRFPTN